jgi:hypothetical protein
MQPAEGAPHLLILSTYNVRTNVAIGPLPISLNVKRLREIEDNSYRGTSVGPSKRHERPAGLRPDIGRVDNRQAAGGEPFGGDEMQHVEGVFGRRLIIFIVGDKTSKEI